MDSKVDTSYRDRGEQLFITCMLFVVTALVVMLGWCAYDLFRHIKLVDFLVAVGLILSSIAVFGLLYWGVGKWMKMKELND